jgi:hypothetical protein
MGRRFFLAVTIMYFGVSSELQITATVFFSMSYLSFLIRIAPFVDDILNYVEMGNEVTILVSLYFCYTFTDYVPTADKRYAIGWAFSAMVFFNIAINFALIAYTMGKAIKALIIKFCKNKNHPKSNKISVIEKQEY